MCLLLVSMEFNRYKLEKKTGLRVPCQIVFSPRNSDADWGFWSVQKFYSRTARKAAREREYEKVRHPIQLLSFSLPLKSGKEEQRVSKKWTRMKWSLFQIRFQFPGGEFKASTCFPIPFIPQFVHARLSKGVTSNLVFLYKFTNNIFTLSINNTYTDLCFCQQCVYWKKVIELIKIIYLKFYSCFKLIKKKFTCLDLLEILILKIINW